MPYEPDRASVRAHAAANAGVHTSAYAGGPFYEGRFSDGKSAAARDVRVAFSPRGLLLRIDGASEDLVWPYGALSTAEPLSTHAIDALVSYKFQPTASLFVPDGGFARKLAEMAPHTTTRAARRRVAVPWLIAAGVVLAIGVLISAAQLSPARTIAGVMPEAVRAKLGEQAVASLTKNRPACRRTAGLEALDALTQRLVKGLDNAPSFHIAVVDYGLVNAFAAPGNKIVLTRGLIEKAGSADEIAGVLAHEMGHAIALDPETGIVRAIGMSAAVELVMGGSGGTVGNIGVLLAQLSYTRQAEAAADETALSLLQKAGISARGFGQFFRRISTELEGGDTSADGGVASILRTHPPTKERIRRVDAVPDYATTPALTAIQWDAMKAMCAKPGQ